MIMTTTVMFMSRFLKTTRKQSLFNQVEGLSNTCPPEKYILFPLASNKGICQGLYRIKCMQLATRGEILQCKQNPLEHTQ